MGGAQQYLNNKVRRLRATGYDPIVISTREGNVLLKYLKPFSDTRMPELRFRPFCYSTHNVQNICRKITYMIGEFDQCFIESNSIAFVEWAEIIAETIQAKHICINLQETHQYDKYQVEYLRYLYLRNSLYGINEKSTGLMLKDLSIIPDLEHSISAECNNVVEDVETNLINQIPNADYTIGSIGRLDKLYIKSGVKSIVEFANKHKDLQINLILIGGGKDGDEDFIQDTLSESHNVHLIITGYLTPIPRELLTKIDCFFSCAGSSRVSMMEGRPTISMTADTGKTIGILNYTTKNTLYMENEEEFTLVDLIEKILLDSFCDKYPTLGMENDVYDFEAEFNRQIGFFSHVSSGYYDSRVLKPITKKDILYQHLGHLLGPRGLDYFQRVLSKISHGASSLIN